MMKIQTSESRRSNADKCSRYREHKGEQYRATNRNRMRAKRAAAIPEFIGVDSEGIGKGLKHRAVLLGVGKTQYVAKDLSKGLDWQEVFQFLYDRFLEKPHAAYVGFYLSYDFNQWLRSLPQAKAWLLLSKAGRAKRRMTEKMARRRQYHPVRLDGWEIDMMGFKRLSIRPIPPGCICGTPMVKCAVKHAAWMHICDAGPFFQTSFINTINPDKWIHDPGGPVCTPEEYERIRVNKNKRSDFTRITKEMKFYNQLENEILARVMARLATGFAKVDIKLGKDEWYGPGATAGKWLRQKGAPKRRDLFDIMPEWFDDICRRSYFGGWFEIFSHGLIRGESWNYDINNAYPYATAKLPHICDECTYRRGNGEYQGNSEYVLLYATLHANGNRIGPVPYRDKHGSILRPAIAKGWYWKGEIDAAIRAGLVKKVFTHEYCELVPCNHPNPFTDIRRLYDLRIEVGKYSAQGMAIKLNNNSAYGKFAQSTGNAPFNNWFYASYITAHCRIQILDAIATHPGKADSVLMVATDGVCFDSKHPTLPITKKLGEWEETTYVDLVLFKPGVYWHKEGKEALLKVKSRGVPKEEFLTQIGHVEEFWREILRYGLAPERTIEVDANVSVVVAWPKFFVPVKFRMKSCNQALNERNWNAAGEVQEQVQLLQDSDPQNKRRRPRYNVAKRRVDSVIHDLPLMETETRYYGEVRYPAHKDLGYGFDGSPIDGLLEAAGVLREKAANYSIGFDENDFEWENVYGDLLE